MAGGGEERCTCTSSDSVLERLSGCVGWVTNVLLFWVMGWVGCVTLVDNVFKSLWNYLDE